MMGNYEHGVLLHLDPKKITLHPGHPNIRGAVRDTTDLQASIKQRGAVEKPLDLWEGDDGELYLIDGHRRRTAAILVGLETVPCIIKDVIPEEIVDMMLVADMQKSLPHIAHDSSGNVIGGIAWAVNHRLTTTGMKKYQLGQVMGLPPDTISAYAALFSEIFPIRARVEDGNLDITVYALIKRQPLEFKVYLLEKRPGRITADYVRRLKKDWATIKMHLDDSDANGESDAYEPEDPAGADPEPMRREKPEEYSVARCLNEALSWLNRVDGRPLGQVERVILGKVERAIAEVE